MQTQVRPIFSGLIKMAELVDGEVDICFCRDQSAGWGRSGLQQCEGFRARSTSSESETDTPLQSPTEFPHLSPEKSPLDSSEAAKLEQFYTETCQCKLEAKGTPCLSLFSREDLSSYCMNCLELLSNELDLVILSQIASCTKPSEGSSRTYSQFLHKWNRISIKTFLFLHGVSHHRYENLCRHYSCHGATPRRHGNVSKSPKHALSLAETQSIVSFLHHFASVHALFLPGWIPGNFDERYVLLPSDMSKRFVYRKYEEACHASLKNCVSRRKFEAIWSSTLPFIVTAKPSTDLCFTCQQNSRLIVKSANLPEHLKTEEISWASWQRERESFTGKNVTVGL